MHAPQPTGKKKVHSAHKPEVCCIAKGNAHLRCCVIVAFSYVGVAASPLSLSVFDPLTMSIRIHSLRLFETSVQTRMPFRYGIAELTSCPHVILAVEVEYKGHIALGMSAENLVPKWFDKDPSKSAAQDLAGMKESIQHAMAISSGLTACSLYQAWRELYAAQMSWALNAHQPALQAHFGVTLVERALIDGISRASGKTFATLLQSNELGILLGDHDPRLNGSDPSMWLPRHPLPTVVLRHTIGLSDWLTETDIPIAARLADGLPQSLEACIHYYGLRQFKIKIQGNAKADLDRLLAVSEVITNLAPANFAFSLDGNEQYKQLGDFASLWDAIQSDGRLRRFFQHLSFIEQPLHRSVALDPAIANFSRHPGLPPTIIDESDAEIDSLRTALEIGYAGTSHKNCKGVCKGIANRCLISALASEFPGGRYLMTAEDLTNTGPIALQQDLAVQAVLGNSSVERNGHHYFNGLKSFPQAWWQPLADAHPDLYDLDRGGWPRVKACLGILNLDSVNRAPFGYGFNLPLLEEDEIHSV